MDYWVDSLHGPNPVQKSGTVTVPRELLRAVGLDLGDRVHWLLNPDMPGTLILVPTRMVHDSLAAFADELKQAGR